MGASGPLVSTFEWQFYTGFTVHVIGFSKLVNSSLILC